MNTRQLKIPFTWLVSVSAVLAALAGGVAVAAEKVAFYPYHTHLPFLVDKGEGLGLSASYGIITEMGGAVTAENHPGGARCTITVPAA